MRQVGPPGPPQNIRSIYFYDNLPPPVASPTRPPGAATLKLTACTTAPCCALAGPAGASAGAEPQPGRLGRFHSATTCCASSARGKAVICTIYASTLPVIRHRQRGAACAPRSGKVPLFVSHDVRFDGSRMSRIVAWRVVQRAARTLGLGSITPHDFRHWRATQLLNAGYALDVVQDYLGHRSVETTRAYYAHTDPLRVDEAARSVGLPPMPDDDPPSG